MVKKRVVRDRKISLKITSGAIVLGIITLFIISMLISSAINAVTEKLMIIPIKGIISPQQEGIFFTQEVNVPFITSCLEKARKDSTIKAVLLDINSPGGTVVGSTSIANKIEKVKEKKPVISYISEVGASGAYWIASYSDRIIAEPFSIVGSVGVTASYLQYSGLLSMLNITYERLVTGKFKDIANPYKELTEEEKKILLKKLRIIHNEFLKVVSENRNLSETEKEEISKSLFYLGKEAKSLGLVDELGDKELAEKIAKKLSGKENLKIYKCEKRESLFPFFKVLSIFSYFLGKGIGSEIISASTFNKIYPFS